jgi:tRNA 5-methylaminomethyl-2-thiouridine biosynthesis bifunctional protein
MSARSRDDPLAEAAGSLLTGCGLPETWRGASAWTVLDLDFDDGVACLATLRAWRDDPQRPARLHVAALLERPIPREALRARLAARGVAASAARALLDAWPPPVTGVHRVALGDGPAMLTLAVGPRARMLPGLVARADSLFVAPPAFGGADLARVPDTPLLRHACARLAIGGRAAAATADDAVARALAQAGMTVRRVDAGSGGPALHAWRTRTHPASGAGAAPASDAAALPPTRPASTSARGSLASPVAASPTDPQDMPIPDATGPHATCQTPPPRVALVVGAGLAGAAVAFALARRGWSVLRLDAGGAACSAQPALAHHPSVTPDDAPLSRLTRAALLLARAAYDVGATRWCGRLQLMDARRADAAAAGLPPEWAEPVDAHRAGAIAGIALRSGGLWLPSAGSADPEALRAGWSIQGVSVRAGAAVARLERRAGAWVALDDRGVALADAPVAILATGARDLVIGAAPDLPTAGLWDRSGEAGLHRRHARTTIATAAPDALPACILGSADGHAVPIDAKRLLLGPVGALDDPTDTNGDDPAGADPERDAEDAASVLAWRRHASRLASPAPAPKLAPGPSGTRLSTRDHLPLIGPVPDAAAIDRLQATARRDDRLALPVLPGLWTATAFGGRGLLWAVLAAELIAARLDAEPMPIERALVDALDPARFVRRSLRRRPVG